MLQTEIQHLELIDGLGKEPAIMTKEATIPTTCDPGKHCAHHGCNPFICCKCGAEFKPAGS